MATPFIHLAGVQKTYRTRGEPFLAISEATFDVEAGELVSLVGPSGLRQDDVAENSGRPALLRFG